MEIELRSPVSRPADHGGSELFFAYLYIDGIKAGIVFNDEDRSATNYVALDVEGAELIKRAEIHCWTLPPACVGELILGMHLKLKVHLMMWEHINEREEKWNKNYVIYAMQNHLLVGTSEKDYQMMRLPETLALQNDQRRQYYWLLKSLEEIKPLLVEGKKILNNNIYGEILEMAGLTKDQYVEPRHHIPDEELEQSKSIRT